jgi:hypothetical protein
MDALIVGLAIVVNTAAANPSAADTRAVAGLTTPQTIRQAVERNDIPLDSGLTAGFQKPGILGQPHTTKFRPRHLKSAKLQAAVAGAGLGLLAGAVIGYGVTTRAGCDMCGLQGLTIGAPIGGAVLSLLAVKLY